MNIGDYTFDVKQPSVIDRSNINFPVYWFWWQSCTERTELSIRNTLSMQVVSKFLGDCRVPFIILSELDIFRANNMDEIFTAEQTINHFFLLNVPSFT
jgi:hypothetical protein